ncbi:MAG: hypothetical protein EZS28_026513 [Streblomastix strix]|uniref:IBR domain-containing protein n=1 Tax=Streblomastix strix TaxID=222440 RepID=A0A5J4V6Y6_9EUKA|nr:MAG: hypothetical protein EZS28_026513 [Streblomastix strix]
MHWCPYPNCQYVIIKKGLITDVKCICGHEFCFVCQKDAHMPATCKYELKIQLRIANFLTEQYVLSMGFVCPLTTCIMRDPVRASDGIAYERITFLRQFPNHPLKP